MKMNVTYFYQTSLRLMAASVLLFIFGQRASAQITTNPAASCNNEYFYCSLDTVTLAPAEAINVLLGLGDDSFYIPAIASGLAVSTAMRLEPLTSRPVMS